MGNIFSSASGGPVGLYMDDKPTFEPHVGFPAKRKQRVMVATEEALSSARIPHKHRDYCSHVLLEYHQCRYKNMPWVYRCHHEKHNFLNCEQQDYVLRMKEFERERRLRIRENRLKEEKRLKDEKRAN